MSNLIKTTVYAVFYTTFFVLSCVATAETYQWRDANGKVVVSDVLPSLPSDIEVRVIGGKKSTNYSGAYATAGEVQDNAQNTKQAGAKPTDAKPVASVKPTEEKTVAEKNLDFQKRQKEAKEKEEKETKERAMAAQKAQQCDQARRQLSALQGGVPFSVLDENGKPMPMDAQKRQAEIEQSERYLTNQGC